MTDFAIKAPQSLSFFLGSPFGIMAKHCDHMERLACRNNDKPPELVEPVAIWQKFHGAEVQAFQHLLQREAAILAAAAGVSRNVYSHGEILVDVLTLYTLSVKYGQGR